jgi:4'-phosphopantetheinyl transferase EntD
VLAGLFPADVAFAWCDPRACDADLLPAEAALVAAAVPKRQREFAAGRTCARRVLGELGIADFPLLCAPTREPLWPAGVVGSISHTEGLCAVVASSAAAYAGLGLDLEPARPLPEEIVGRVLHAEEPRDDGGLAGLAPGVARRLRFSAKEAVFKCQFPLTREFLEFVDVAIDLDERGTFAPRFLPTAPALPALAGGARLHGRWVCRDGFLLTAAWVPAPATRPA